MELKTMAQVKRTELVRVYDKLVAIRSSSYLWNNIPRESEKHVEDACRSMQEAIREYDKVTGR